MNLDQIFDQVSTSMRADFQKTREALVHPGMKGDAFEEIFRVFLRQYFPAFLAIAPGVLVDATGKTSRQLDAIVFDAHRTPVLFASGETRVVPIECAYAVIEIKARLDAAEIQRVFENMLSVRMLKKKAWRPDAHPFEHNLYGKKWDIWPVMYFVFAFDSVDLTAVARGIDSGNRGDALPEWSRVDAVCVLDRGIVFNQGSDGMYSVYPTPGSRICVCRTSQSLLMFYMMIFNILAEARLPPFRVFDYLQDAHWGSPEFLD